MFDLVQKKAGRNSPLVLCAASVREIFVRLIATHAIIDDAGPATFPRLLPNPVLALRVSSSFIFG